MNEKFDEEFVIKVMKLYKLKKILFESSKVSKRKIIKKKRKIKKQTSEKQSVKNVVKQNFCNIDGLSGDDGQGDYEKINCKCDFFKSGGDLYNEEEFDGLQNRLCEKDKKRCKASGEKSLVLIDGTPLAKRNSEVIDED